MEVVKSVVQKVWERSSYDCSRTEQVPMTAFIFALNYYPDDFKEFGRGPRQWGAILDKVKVVDAFYIFR